MCLIIYQPMAPSLVVSTPQGELTLSSSPHAVATLGQEGETFKYSSGTHARYLTGKMPSIRSSTLGLRQEGERLLKSTHGPRNVKNQEFRTMAASSRGSADPSNDEIDRCSVDDDETGLYFVVPQLGWSC